LYKSIYANNFRNFLTQFFHIFTTHSEAGVGVSEDDKTIFEPFQPKKEGECGTGVGLYVLRKRVESLSGTFGVRENTDAGMGSIFWFAVPYEGASIFTDAQRVRMASREREAAPASAAAQGVSQAPRTWTDEVNKVVDKTTSIMLPSRERQLPSSMNSLAQKAASGREKDEEVSCGKTKRKSSSGGSESDLDVDRVRAYRLKAIIVEDTPSVSKLLQKMMLSLGYESVECYANGALGLEAMKQKQVDVVITDVNMPIMNGDKMVSAFREYEQQMLQSGERTSSQMIVACSANCNAILEAKLIQVGCDGVYAKPLARRHVLELTKEFAIEQLGNRAETC
jgi:CheY-like chemotaxis protein